jgi:hypothetical protein
MRNEGVLGAASPSSDQSQIFKTGPTGADRRAFPNASSLLESIVSIVFNVPEGEISKEFMSQAVQDLEIRAEFQVAIQEGGQETIDYRNAALEANALPEMPLEPPQSLKKAGS